jgi:two-component system, NtrC family, nitrogen regulation sensor histidine kinase NtrY
MLYKHFRLRVVLRISLIIASILLFFFMILQTDLYATTALTGVAIVIQVYGLIRYVEQTNRDISRFLLAIRYGDYSQTFTPKVSGKSFEELNTAFNEVIGFIREQRSDKEEQSWYLQAVVQHIGIGLIAFRKNGEIDLMNNAAKKLLRTIRINTTGDTAARPFFRTIRSLGEIYKPLADAVHELRDGGRKIVKIQTMDDIFHLALNATVFKLGGERYTLVSFQNIGRELEEKEMEAWQNLIRVLTHEIMNSVTPIASLASTGSSMVRNEIYDESIDDIRDAFQTIEKRSEGLLHFINAYRNLTRIPKPSFQITPVKDIFNTMVRLFNTQITESDIMMETSIEPTRLEVTADPELIEQVLINLLKNSIEALMHTKGAKIRLSARIDGQGRVVMHVADNGPGIVPEAIDKIFIPFFTTKENGSGIGLSLARQIMRLHGGSINVRSEAGVETVFSLRF